MHVINYYVEPLIHVPDEATISVKYSPYLAQYRVFQRLQIILIPCLVLVLLYSLTSSILR